MTRLCGRVTFFWNMKMPSGQKISSSLTGSAIRLTPDDASRLASEYFGVAGTASALTGERDENFLIRAGKTFVLKITHPDEDRGAVSFQTEALLRVAAVDPGLPTPRVLPAKNGKHEVEFQDRAGAIRTLRLLSFLPGVMAARQPQSSGFRLRLGNILARFDRALEGFSHRSDSYELSWDISQAGKLRPLLPEVTEANRADAERALDHFDLAVAPALSGLRHQVIHNDLNPFNVLVDETDPSRITGLLDFGDMIRAPLINDLAIACAYQVGRGGDPLAPVLEVVAGYHGINPLRAEECDLIYDLMATRLAMTVLIAEWRAARHPENRPYILKNHPAAVTGLIELGAIARTEAQCRFRRACGLET